MAVNGSKFDRLCFCDAGRPESLVTFGKIRISKGCKIIISVASCCWGFMKSFFFLFFLMGGEGRVVESST